MKILKQYKKIFIAIVYCQRFATPIIYENLRQLDIIIIDAKTKLLSRRQKLPEFAHEIKQLHPWTVLECYFISTILRKQSAVYNLVLKKTIENTKKKAQQEEIEH